MKSLRRYNLSDLYEMSSGISTRPEQAGHGAPFLSFSTVFNDHFLPRVLPDRMNTSAAEQESYSIRAGDVFLTRTSETLDELGMSSVAAKDYPNATYSGFLKRLRPTQTDKAYNKFMAFYLRGKTFRKAMDNNAVMTLRCSFNEQIFSYLELLLPDFDAQKKIGDFLYLIHEKIELNNQINSELEAMAKLLYDYWFVQFDFPMTAAQAAALGRPNLTGKPYRTSGGKMVHNPSLNRKIPQGWETEKLDSIVESIFTGLNPRKHFELGRGDNFYVTIKNMEHGRVVLDQKCDKVDDEALARINRRSDLNIGDILFTSIEPVGRLYLIHEKPRNWNINESVFSIRPKPGTVTSAFLYYLLSSEYCRGYCKKVSTGSIHKGIRITDLRAFEFARPPAGLIQAFTEVAGPLLRQAFVLEQQNQELAQLRDWLLPMLMNGQVTVG